MVQNRILLAKYMRMSVVVPRTCTFIPSGLLKMQDRLRLNTCCACRRDVCFALLRVRLFIGPRKTMALECVTEIIVCFFDNYFRS